MGVLIVVLGLFPLLFLILFGSKLTPVRNKQVKLWHICIISAVLWFVTCFVNAKIISHALTVNGSKCGMPYVGLLAIETVIGAVIVIVMFVQLSIKFIHRNSKI